MSVFGERLRTIREENNMMAKDLAKLVGVEPASITNWEKGTRFPKDNAIIKIAEIFNVTTDFLLGRDINDVTTTGSTLRGVQLSRRELINIDKEVEKILSDLPKAKVVEFSGTPADEDDLEFLKAAYTKFLADVRYYNKMKYTPKKYMK